ncbi:MAG: hypothetical protein CMM94_05945 [Rickettsiales bacterium]|nr:hypothetical protein [Rickettsiales bacterium]|tara:strand:- start:518 stop:1117 length:600 start_codon:yes stop_codon:yes gene_type:complete
MADPHKQVENQLKNIEKKQKLGLGANLLTGTSFAANTAAYGTIAGGIAIMGNSIDKLVKTFHGLPHIDSAGKATPIDWKKNLETLGKEPFWDYLAEQKVSFKLENLGEIVKDAMHERPKAALAIIGGSVALGALDAATTHQWLRISNDRDIGKSVRNLRKIHSQNPDLDKDSTGRAILGDWTGMAENRLLNAHETGQIR